MNRQQKYALNIYAAGYLQSLLSHAPELKNIPKNKFIDDVKKQFEGFPYGELNETEIIEYIEKSLNRFKEIIV